MQALSYHQNVHLNMPMSCRQGHRQEYRTERAVYRLWENITSKEKINDSGPENKDQSLAVRLLLTT